MSTDTTITAQPAACCAPVVQETCCEAADKASCCGPEQTSEGSCGCK